MLLATREHGGEGRGLACRLDDLVGEDREARSWSSSTARRASKGVAALWPDMAVQRCTVHKYVISSRGGGGGGGGGGVDQRT